MTGLVSEGLGVHWGHTKLTIGVIIRFPQQPRLLAGNLVELDEHALHGHVAAIPFAGKHNCAVAPRAQLLGLVDLQAAHLEDLARELATVVGSSHDVGLDPGIREQRVWLVDHLLDGFLGGLVAAGLGILALVFVALSVLDAATTAPVALLLLGRLPNGGGITVSTDSTVGLRSLGCRLDGKFRLVGERHSG